MSKKFFDSIAGLKVYIADGIKNGELLPEEYIKIAPITARRGQIGEKVSTIMANGMHETDNAVTADPQTGKPGWIVKSIGGEEYIVPDSTFCRKYELVDEKKMLYKSKGNPIIAVQIDDDISFIAPWGEMMNIAAGGYIVLSECENIYGIQGKEFAELYSGTGKNAAQVLDTVKRWLNI